MKNRRIKKIRRPAGVFTLLDFETDGWFGNGSCIGYSTLKSLCEEFPSLKRDSIEETINEFVRQDNLIILLGKPYRGAQPMPFDLSIATLCYHPDKRGEEFGEPFDCVIELPWEDYLGLGRPDELKGYIELRK